MSLSISHLSKAYNNGVKALNDLDLTIGTGMFGLLGPNGAGKSTLMRTVATLQSPDEGEIVFNGIDVIRQPMELRKILGYLPQEFGVYARESAENLLNYMAILKGISSKKDRSRVIDYVLEVTNLTDVRKKNVSGYSGGMKQRFGIAQLLLNDPKLIIVDEPTAGLDPAERNRFLNILREIGTKNTVIFSTHIVDDIKDLCTDMAILNQGQICIHATPEEACLQLSQKVWTRNIPQAELGELSKQYNVLSSAFNADNSLRIRVYATDSPGPDFQSVVPHLEDVYFATLKNFNGANAITSGTS